MRSYYSHLQEVKSIGEEVPVNRKPVFRSSAIFPVQHNQHFSTKIIFMGYWLLKRNIKEIGLLYTLRSAAGEILSRKYILVDSSKAFEVRLSEFEGLVQNEFTGSLELEIYSTQDLVYPYPAFVLVYFGEHFSTAVHSVGRIYNDIEDLVKNEEYKVKESGFDIYGHRHLSPFVALTNGAMANAEPTITYQINSKKSKTVQGNISLPSLKPFETVFIKLKDYIDLEKILGTEEAGAIKLGHNFEGFFPRFAVGNFDEELKTVSITHSYYDCSELNDEKSFWNRKNDLFNDSSVSIPLYITNGFYTRIAVYPIFSPSDFTLSYDFYNADGKLLKSLPAYHHVSSKDDRYEQIDFGSIVKQEGIDPDEAVSVNLICNWNDKSKIPTRVKFGLNVGHKNTLLPCNICFAPQLGNPEVLKKAGTFRWAPFVNEGRSEVVFTNSASLKNYTTPANVTLTFHRQQDNETKTCKLVVVANGTHIINLERDSELEEFFNGKSGWVTAQSDNPFLNGYYFDFFENGTVGADHIF